MTDVIEDNNKIAVSVISGVFQHQDLATETDLLEEMKVSEKRQVGFKCRACGKEGHISRNC